MPQANGPELFRVQPDAPPAPLPDVGVHSWPVGSFMPVGLYRPVPIVRFTGTIVFQSLANLVLHDLLFEAPGAATIGACALVALLLARRAFARWLGQASQGWKIATIMVLALNLLPVTLACVGRLDGPGTALQVDWNPPRDDGLGLLSPG